MGFVILSMYFLFRASDFLDFEFLLSFDNMMFEYGLGIFVEFVKWVLLVFGSMVPIIHVFMFASHFLVVYPVCVVLCISCS